MVKAAVVKVAVDRYKVLVRIWHTGDNRYYEAGEKVAMAHLADFQIERLIAQGIIAPMKSRKGAASARPNLKQEEKHGDIDSTEH